MKLFLLLLGILVPLTCAWIPFIGEETHKHLRLTSQHGEWDLLQLVSLNTSQAGVSSSLQLGPLNTTAYRLKEQYSLGMVSPVISTQIVSHMTNEMSCYFVFRQHNNTVATLLSAGVPGSVRPWLQVSSDLKHRRLQLLYRVKGDAHTHQLMFPLPKKVGHTWTKVLLTINSNQAKLWVNCNTLEKQALAGTIDLKMPTGGVIYFSQEPESKNKLLGSVQAAKLFNFSARSRLWRCNFDGQFGPGWKPPLIG